MHRSISRPVAGTSGIWNFERWRIGLLKPYYEEAKYNAAFDRCVDVMARMIQKYGPQILDKLENDDQTMADTADCNQQEPPLSDKAA